MADEITPQLGLTNPEVGGSQNTWGGKLNENFSLLDSFVSARILRSGDTMSGALGIVPGTPTAPGLFFSGDSNTGIYQPTANQWAISIDGTPRFSLSATTTEIANNLSVTGSYTLNGAANLNGGASTTNLSYSGSLTGGTGIINIGAGQVYKDAAGNVGIGTSAPSAAVDVVKTNFVGAPLISARFNASNFRMGFGIGNTNGFPFLGVNVNNALNDNGTFDINNYASRIRMDNGLTQFQVSSTSGPAGGAITWNTQAVLDPAGNLGLGVTPSAWSGQTAFQLSLGSLASGAGEFNLGFNTYFNAGFKYVGANGALLYSQNGSTHRWLTAPPGIAGDPISFREDMTLTSGGNLLVGTTSQIAGEKFTFFGNYTAYVDGVFTAYTGKASGIVNSGAAADFAVRSDSNLILAAGGSTERARITSAGYFKASNTGTYGGVAGLADQTNSASHIFQSNATTGYSVQGINGTTGANAICFGSFLPTGATGIHYEAAINNAQVYRVLANGNVQNTNNSYGAISDIKLKENITDATPKLSQLNQLRVVNYNLIGSELKQIGLIAQEVEEVFPGLVESTPDTVEVTKTRTVEVPAVLDEEGNEVTPATTTEETYTEREPNGEVTKAVKYSVLVPMLLKAVQELSAQNAALESRLAALEHK